ncbi:MAG: metallophosphoesterase [Actinomycetota bacterium]|nr:metallophosphoesterase [Actinomycetota bacterium]
MTIADVPLRIAQLASIHCGDLLFRRELMRSTVERVNRLRADVVLVAGDLTAEGYPWEYQEAVEWLEQIQAPTVVVPGNHDSRNVGYIHFQRHFGQRFSRYRLPFDAIRAERLQATGLTVVGADSSQPDLEQGHVGRERYSWIREQFDEPDDIKLFVIHHLLVAVPGAGRDLNVLTDAGDLLPVLNEAGVEIVVSGHKHVPFFWGLNGMLLCNSGTTATKQVRGLVPPSWSELQVDVSTIKIYLHYEDGRREISAIRSRSTQQLIREAFYMTTGFLDTNHILEYQ